jgi:hypothetical protein
MGLWSILFQLMKLNITRVPLSTLAAFLIAVAAHPHSDEEIIGQFAGGMSKTTAASFG